MKRMSLIFLLPFVAVGCGIPQKPDDLTPAQHAQGVTATCPPPLVPDETTAIKIAEAVWTAKYGDAINHSRPFRAQLKDGVWIVAGSLPRGYQGGVPIAKIARDDGRILQMIHTQ